MTVAASHQREKAYRAPPYVRVACTTVHIDPVSATVTQSAPDRLFFVYGGNTSHPTALHHVRGSNADTSTDTSTALAGSTGGGVQLRRQSRVPRDWIPTACSGGRVGDQEDDGRIRSTFKDPVVASKRATASRVTVAIAPCWVRSYRRAALPVNPLVTALWPDGMNPTVGPSTLLSLLAVSGGGIPDRRRKRLSR